MHKIRIRAHKVQMLFPLVHLLRNKKNKWFQLKKNNISVPFFFHTNIHIVYFKTFRGLVEIQFASWPNVMKKIIFAAEIVFFVKSVIFQKLKYIYKHRDGFGGHLEQKQSLKLDVAFKNWIPKMPKRFLPKALKQCHIAEIWNEKSCDMYFSTVVYKVVKCKFEYRKSR